MKYHVQTELLVHCKIVVEVEANSSQEALDAAAEVLPANYDASRSKQWKADVTLKPPKGVKLIGEAKAHYFEQTSGGDKAKKVSP